MKNPIDQAVHRNNLYGTNAEPAYSGVLSFMRRKYTRELVNVDVAVTGIPFDVATSNRPGSRFGPRAIREASSQLSWEKLDDWGFDVFDKLAIIDYGDGDGDCDFDHGRPEIIPARIQEHTKEIISENVGLLTLGGDHFVTYPILKAHAEKYGPLSLIHFDAHSDTWEDDDGRVDHGTMFYHAAKDGIVNAEQSVQIGLRTFNEDAWGFNVLKAQWVHEKGISSVIEQIRKIVSDNRCYLTFDIDCLDPCYAPGTGTPVIGGLSTYQAQQILRGLAAAEKTLQILDETSALDDIAAYGISLQKGIRAILNKRNIAHSFVGHPSMGGLIFSSTAPTIYRDWVKTDYAFYEALAPELHEMGVLVEPDSREPLFISTAHDDSCLSDTLNRFEQAVDTTLEKMPAINN